MAFGDFSLAGKTAVVTGGASGIGRAVCDLFARKGAAVEVFEVDEAAGRAAVAEINAADPLHEAHLTVVDVTSLAAVGEAFADVEARRGGLDVLVNNAGIGLVADVERTTEEDFARVHDVNVRGVFHCLHHGVRLMLRSGGGAIVNLASIASVMGMLDRFAYQSSKGAVLAMTYSIATDYVTRGIRCNAVCPARVHTPFVDAYLAKNYPGQEKAVFDKLSEYQPIGRMGRPEEIAALILYLASDEAAFVTGAAMGIDGGVAVMGGKL